ncbi:lipoate--protein ligase family protein [Lacticigenium naphthae]|uniref:lipoate--protein ligase family protein n=1 Tax=Lacticigenium naphthae TaxID=515351 RepID=UPI0004100EF2|nr:lipoate--protein ligase family protein [Lacticigenium naphthae]
MKIEDLDMFFPYNSSVVYDALTMPYQDPYLSHFALTDTLIELADSQHQSSLHFWTEKDLIVLGMMDSKLPFLKKGLDFFKENRYSYMVRNSGGLAVVSNEGILNFSIILPTPSTRTFTINEGYQLMHGIIQKAFEEYGQNITAIEIPQSYCPGDYDLSINGKKIAGIAQRRIRGGVAIMIYISISGNQDERGQLIRSFYKEGLQNKQVKWDFPDVDPNVMTTLSEALHTEFTVEQAKEKISRVFQLNGISLHPAKYTQENTKIYQKNLTKMIKRNEQLFDKTIKKEASL